MFVTVGGNKCGALSIALAFLTSYHWPLRLAVCCLPLPLATGIWVRAPAAWVVVLVGLACAVPEHRGLPVRQS